MSDAQRAAAGSDAEDTNVMAIVGGVGVMVCLLGGMILGVFMDHFPIAIVLLVLVVPFAVIGHLATRDRTDESGASDGYVPVAQWGGLLYMTKRDAVPARCTSCQKTYEVAGPVANTVADQQSASSKLIRWGTRTEQVGATFTIGASGRRIAAGNESDRQKRQLAAARSLVACPRCGSESISLLRE